MPLNDEILIRTNPKVLNKPSPNIGNILWGVKFLILANKRKIILAKTKGRINELVILVVLN